MNIVDLKNVISSIVANFPKTFKKGKEYTSVNHFALHYGNMSKELKVNSSVYFKDPDNFVVFVICEGNRFVVVSKNRNFDYYEVNNNFSWHKIVDQKVGITITDASFFPSTYNDMHSYFVSLV